MPDIRLKNFLTGKDDPTIGNVTFLSRPAEYHALAVGVTAGLTGSQAAIVGLALYLLGRETKALAELPDNLHVRDALREPAYALGGIVLGMGLHGVAWGVPDWILGLV